jgi:ankyrin repeat protein
MGADYPRIVALLLENGANPNLGRAGGVYNPLACAARARNIESLQLMFAYGGDASRVDADGGNVLHAALRNTNAECCRELLTHGADPCGKGGDDYGTPMHVAAKFACVDDGPERVKILDLLLEAGASPLAVNTEWETPGELARQRGAPKDVLDWFSQHEKAADRDGRIFTGWGRAFWWSDLSRWGRE